MTQNKPQPSRPPAVPIDPMIAPLSGSPRKRWVRRMVLVLILASLFAGGHWGSQWLIAVVGLDQFMAFNIHARHAMILGVLLYGVLLAIPFMPGIEVSLALLAAFGPEVALMLYGATVAALMVSFLVGRFLPLPLIASIMGRLGLRYAEHFVQRMAPLDAPKRMETLVAYAPKWIVSTLLNHRYLAVAVAFNLPGNAIIGGGGGIALMAGVSNLFSAPRYFIVVLLATMPVPFGVLLLSNG